MNKAELIHRIAQRSGLNKSDAASALESVIDVITETIGQGGEVRLVNFGCFSLARRKAGIGRNPHTGQVIDLPESRTVRFRPGRVLKAVVNGALPVEFWPPEEPTAEVGGGV